MKRARRSLRAGVDVGHARRRWTMNRPVALDAVLRRCSPSGPRREVAFVVALEVGQRAARRSGVRVRAGARVSEMVLLLRRSGARRRRRRAGPRLRRRDRSIAAGTPPASLFAFGTTADVGVASSGSASVPTRSKRSVPGRGDVILVRHRGLAGLSRFSMRLDRRARHVRAGRARQTVSARHARNDDDVPLWRCVRARPPRCRGFQAPLGMLRRGPACASYSVAVAAPVQEGRPLTDDGARPDPATTSSSTSTKIHRGSGRRLCRPRPGARGSHRRRPS